MTATMAGIRPKARNLTGNPPSFGGKVGQKPQKLKNRRIPGEVPPVFTDLTGSRDCGDCQIVQYH